MGLAVGADDRLYVVVGILYDTMGRVLIQQRRPGTPKAGKWEFPGGKLEPGETPAEALTRELKEELSIDVVGCSPLVVIKHDYAHARVILDTYIIDEVTGEARGNEGQLLAWVSLDEIPRYDVLDAVHPIVDALLTV